MAGLDEKAAQLDSSAVFMLPVLGSYLLDYSINFIGFKQLHKLPLPLPECPAQPATGGGAHSGRGQGWGCWQVINDHSCENPVLH